MAYLSKDNAIPLMTSDTTPSGVASASSSANAAWHAFTNSTNDWRTATGQLSGWIRYDFPREVAIGQYSIVPYGGTGGVVANPKFWVFEGSNDGVNWMVLDSRSNQTVWTSSVDYTISNKVRYSKYRLNIRENNGHASWVGIRQLMMFEYVFENKFLILSDDSKYYSIKSSDPYLNLIPAMTSSTAPQGVASASSVEGSNAAYKAFDNLFTGNGWIAGSRNLTDQWLAYQFKKPTIINKYTITVTYEKSTAPKDWIFQGSDDGANWNDLDSQTEVTGWSLGVKREFEFSNRNAYLIYRIFINSNDGSSYYVSIGEMEMMQNYIGLISIGGATVSEDIIIKNGMNKQTIVDMNKVIPEKLFFDSESEVLGSGRLFKKSVETSKVPVKKVRIE